MDSKILLSDEATSALDPKTTDSILDLLLKINEELGITIVVVTHQMEVIKKICDKLTVLSDGEEVLSGRTSEIFLYNQNKINKTLGGGNLVDLPTEGVNIRIISTEQTKEKKILSSLARDTGVSYSVPWSNIERFKDGVFAIIYINIKLEDCATVREYLNNNEMEWEVV